MFIQNSTGLSNPDTLLTFDEVVQGDNTPLTTEYSAFGVTFTNIFYNSGGNSAVGGNVGAPHIGNFQAGGFQSASFSFNFTTPVEEAAFAFASSFNGTATFTALLNGSQVDTGIGPIGVGGNDFYGFQGVTFDQLSVVYSGLGNNAAVFDSLQFTPVPEPSTLLATGAGVTALFAFKRRRSPSVH